MLTRTTTRFGILRGRAHAWVGALVLVAPLTCFGSGVELVRNINRTPIPQNSNPAALGVVGGKMLFGATDATGPGLWSTDGSAGGTQLVQRLTGSGIAANSPWNDFLAAGSGAYFVSADDVGLSSVWVTDGTSAGTRRIKTFASGTSATANLLGFLGGTLILSSFDPSARNDLLSSP